MSDCYSQRKISNTNFSDSYKYVENLPKFHKFRKKGYVFDDIYTIEDNIKRTTGILITGNESCDNKYGKRSLKLGDSNYFKSGKCGINSSPKCIGKDRYIIVNNLPKNIKNNKGLVPSIIGDITDDLNPGKLMWNLNGTGKDVNNNCSMKKITFKQHYPNSRYTAKKTKRLCISDDSYNDDGKTAIKKNSNENFSDYNSGIKQNLIKNKKYIFYFIFFILVLCVFFSFF